MTFSDKNENEKGAVIISTIHLCNDVFLLMIFRQR